MVPTPASVRQRAQIAAAKEPSDRSGEILYFTLRRNTFQDSSWGQLLRRGWVVVGVGNDCHLESWVEAQRVALAFPFPPKHRQRFWTLQEPLIAGLAVVPVVAVQGSNPSLPAATIGPRIPVSSSWEWLMLPTKVAKVHVNITGCLNGSAGRLRRTSSSEVTIAARWIFFSLILIKRRVSDHHKPSVGAKHRTPAITHDVERPEIPPQPFF